MLDSYFVKNNTPRDVFTKEYRPDQAITERRLVNDSGDHLNIIFPPWHGGGQAYERLISRFAKKGDAVLAYNFNDEILKPSTEAVLSSYEFMGNSISTDLTDLVGARTYKRVRLIGLSLGNTVIAKTISKFEEFDSATLVCTASSLASSMWHGIRTQHIRAGIEQHGQDISHVEEAWHDLAPSTHIGVLAGKDITVIVSSTDQIIPTRFQWEFVKNAKESGVNPNVETTRLGHYATIGRYCLYGKN